MERVEHTHPESTDELLSAYVDDAVDVVERRRAEGYIERCPACAHELRELRMFKALMSDLPTVQPPRSFTLDPYAAPPQRRLLFPTLRWATLAATLLLLLVIGVDGLGGANGGANAPTSGGTTANQQFSTRQAPMEGSGSGGSTGSAASAAASIAAAPEAAMALPSTAAEASAAAQAEEAGEAATASEQPEASAAASKAPVTAMDALDPTQAAAVSSGATGYDPQAATAASAESDPLATTRPAQEPVDPATAAGGVSALQSNGTSSPDTTQLTQPQTVLAARDEGSVNTLQIAQIVLAVIALGLGLAALYAWRRQL